MLLYFIKSKVTKIENFEKIDFYLNLCNEQNLFLKVYWFLKVLKL